MPKAYSEDLRKRVIAARRSGKGADEVAAVFGVHRNCVYRWDKQERLTGSVAAGYDRVTGRKPKIKVDEKFEALARMHMHSTLEKMAHYWEGEVSRMSMSRSLSKLGWSRKKSLRVPGSLPESASKVRKAIGENPRRTACMGR